MKRSNQIVLSLALTVLTAIAASGSVDAGELTRYAKPGEPFCYAVSAERGDLLYTRQFRSATTDGLMEALKRIAGLAGSSLNEIVKLNVFIRDDSPELRDAAEEMIRTHWPAGKTPAVMFIPGKIAGNETFACDAVFSLSPNTGKVKPFGSDGAVAPEEKDMIFASGRVGKGDNYSLSVPSAITQLLEDYIYPQGSGLDDVVQIRAYIDDMDNWKQAEQEVHKMFSDRPPPPVILIEWARPGMVEIEMTAGMTRRVDAPEGVSFYTPETMKPSPVFSRVAVLHSSIIIYLSGMTGSENDSPESEVTSLFEELKVRSESTGSDLHHLVKATYLVCDKDVDKAVTLVRPKFYDPARPPAASKIFRNTIGVRDRHLLIDMIAVPR